jgi:hypothetical protein
MNAFQKGKDLTKEAPRSPHQRIGDFVILARTIDKCRALLFGNVGEYHFDCPLDNTLFGFKGIKGDDFKKFVSEGHSDEEILKWVMDHGSKKSSAEIRKWSTEAENDNYDSKPAEKKAWLSGAATKLGLDKDATLFDYLDADDKASFKK